MSANGTVATAVPLLLDRWSPPSLACQAAQRLEQSNVVDDLYVWDQLVSWWPRVLWRPEHAPLAHLMEDCDSFADAFTLAAMAAATTNRLGTGISTDAVRRGPAELTQTMLTLAAATEGRATLMLGAGEAKQTNPFGYRRAEGLARLEDTLQLFRLLLERDEPFDFEGRFWTFRNAWLGAARPYRPKVWAMGGGPQLIDLAARYADGFVTAVPLAVTSPERYAEQVAEIKRRLEGYGRDPDTFDFAVMAQVLVHEDREVIAGSSNNPLLRWIAAVFGRLNQADWAEKGIEPVFPHDWHYAIKLVPTEWTVEAVNAVTDKVTPEMFLESFYHGTVEDVAATLEGYVQAGATWVTAVDLLPLVLPADQSAAAWDRSIALCRTLKGL
jgi:phthiodiolone/phenolphthiodiolone dimycocerosates ketoreductase